MSLKEQLLDLILQNSVVQYHATGKTHRGATIVVRGMSSRFDKERFCQDAAERLGVDPSEIHDAIFAIKDRPPSQ